MNTIYSVYTIETALHYTAKTLACMPMPIYIVREGQILTKNADNELLSKMLQWSGLECIPFRLFLLLEHLLC